MTTALKNDFGVLGQDGARGSGVQKDNVAPSRLTEEEIDNKRVQFSQIEDYEGLEYAKATVYDLLSEIKDPEHNATLEELDIVSPERISLKGNYWKLISRICLFL